MHISIRNKAVQFFVFAIVCVITALLFNWKTAGEPYVVFRDTQTLERLDIAISSDQDTRMILLTRLLHNKPAAYIETALFSIFRSLDPVFLFSLPGPTSMYEQLDKIQVLYQFEFIVFVFSVVYLIRKWNRIGKYFQYLPYMLIVSVLLCGLLLPLINTMKLLPLLVTIRFIEVTGVLLFTEDKIWKRKK
jgi:hypothetical protein